MDQTEMEKPGASGSLLGGNQHPMVTHVTEISTPPTPADPPAEFEQKAALVWSELHQAVPQMNQQADEIEQIGVDAQAAKERAIQESDAALGYRNETRAARDAALPAAATATDMAAQAVVAKEQTEEFRDEAQAAAASAANRVAKTSDTGAALLPEGGDAQRPATGSIPAGAAVVRGSTQEPADYKLELWNRVTAVWDVLATRFWVIAKINELINDAIGYAIVYPNGGTEASPANVAVSSRYEVANPFPGKNVVCIAEVRVGGKWSPTGWVYTGSSQGVMASLFDDKIVVQTAQYIVGQGDVTGCPNPAVVGSINTPTPCRVKVYKVKG